MLLGKSCDVPENLIEEERIRLNYNLAYPFYTNYKKNPENPALWVDNKLYSYAELAVDACRISEWLHGLLERDNARVAVLAYRQIAVYRGILGACWSGDCYVPLNPHFPEQRLVAILSQARPGALIIDQAVYEKLSPEFLDLYTGRILIADHNVSADTGGPIANFDSLPHPEIVHEPKRVDADAEAYLVFTSGTTGQPCGVVVRTGSLSFSIRAISRHYPFTTKDRFSQYFDLSFDFSVMDLFVPWLAGASTYVVPDSQKMAPGHFIKEHDLTVWTCVPSLITIMAQMNLLKPGLYPSLKYSFFSGEKLTGEAAGIWHAATPHGIVVNLYGQSETIIASLAYNYDPGLGLIDKHASVPLGTELDGIMVGVVDESRAFVGHGTTGELAISGPHVARGYLDNPKRTADKFRELTHPEYGAHFWYITGDLAYQDETGIFHFLGRADNEVKIKGNRILLEEVEDFLRQYSGCDVVAAIPSYTEGGIVECLIGFVAAESVDEIGIKNRLREVLPLPAVPRRIQVLKKLPLSQNGKVDRKALRAAYLNKDKSS